MNYIDHISEVNYEIRRNRSRPIIRFLLIFSLTLVFSAEIFSPIFQNFTQDIECTEYSENDSEEKENKKEEFEDKYLSLRRTFADLNIERSVNDVETLNMFKQLILSKVPTPPPDLA